ECGGFILTGLYLGISQQVVYLIGYSHPLSNISTAGQDKVPTIGFYQLQSKLKVVVVPQIASHRSNQCGTFTFIQHSQMVKDAFQLSAVQLGHENKRRLTYEAFVGV